MVSLRGTMPEIFAGCAQGGFRNIKFSLGQVHTYLKEGHEIQSVAHLLKDHDLHRIYGYEGFFSIELFSDDLWALPAEEAARQMRDSMKFLA
jgi:sugar phosphate isomerase/epimerase